MNNGGPQVSIILPTYNERENIPELFQRIDDSLSGNWTYEIIVVDDNSPDDTAGAVVRLVDRFPSVKLVRRPEKSGLASAIAAGFSLAQGDSWVMMDADLSHRPEDLPALIEGLVQSDISVGSRYIPGGGTAGWPVYRKIISKLASTFARLSLGLAIKDTTSGFAAFRKGTIEPILPSLEPRGFKLLLEILAKAPGARTIEVPIIFVGRQHGQSKLAASDVLAFLRLCLHLRRP